MRARAVIMHCESMDSTGRGKAQDEHAKEGNIASAVQASAAALALDVLFGATLHRACVTLQSWEGVLLASASRSVTRRSNRGTHAKDAVACRSSGHDGYLPDDYITRGNDVYVSGFCKGGTRREGGARETKRDQPLVSRGHGPRSRGGSPRMMPPLKYIARSMRIYARPNDMP